MSDPLMIAYQRAWAAFELRQFDLCQSIIVDVLRESPEWTSLIALLAHVHLAKGEAQLARNAARRVIDQQPDDARGYYLLAWGTVSDPSYSPTNDRYRAGTDSPVQAHQDRIGVARELVGRCFQIDPEDSDFFGLLAEIEMLSDQPTAALEAANEGLRHSPHSTMLLEARMRGLEKLGRPEEAIETGRCWLEVAAEDDSCHHRLAKIYLKQRNPSAAIRHGREAIRLSPDDPEYRVTYWDAIKSKNPWFRPLVYWQFVVRFLASFPNWIRTTSFYAAIVLFSGLVILTKAYLESDGMIILINTAMLMGIVLVMTERPCMALVDLILFTTDPTFRMATDRRKLAIESGVTIVALLLVTCFVLLAFEITWPILLLVAGFFFATPVFYLFTAEGLIARCGFALQIAALAALLFFTQRHFQQSMAGSQQRILSFYGYALFAFLSIAGPALYQHLRSQSRSD